MEQQEWQQLQGVISVLPMKRLRIALAQLLGRADFQSGSFMAR